MSKQVPGLPTPRVLEAYRQLLATWPVPSQQQHVVTAFGETFLVSCGPADAPPLLLLHGTLSNAASWMHDAARWSKHFRVHAVDIVGEAGLSAPNQPSLHDDSYARWIDEIMDALGVSKAAFVGLSLGGFLALDYALRRPQRTGAIVAISPPGIGRQRPFLLKVLPLLLMGRRGRERIRAKVAGPYLASPLARERPLLDLIALIHDEVRPRALRIPRLSDARLTQLRAPMRLIVGGRDALIDTQEAVHRINRHAPHVEVTWLPNAFHYIPDLGEDISAWLVARWKHRVGDVAGRHVI